MQTHTLNFSGRAAIVTGGASGIGLAVAKRLAASGARVSVWDFAEFADKEAGTGLHFVKVDVSSEASVNAALTTTLKEFGKVDVLVCSAGINGINAPTADYPLKIWQQVMDVNLTGVFLCNKAVSIHMAANNYGRIVNLASIAGKEGNPNAVAYSASKAGVISITKSLGKELAKTGIRVNCVTPAAIETAMLSQVTPQHIEYMLSKIPMGRLGQADEAASMVAWLASEECSFATGAIFDLSGGRATY